MYHQQLHITKPTESFRQPLSLFGPSQFLSFGIFVTLWSLIPVYAGSTLEKMEKKHLKKILPINPIF